MPGSKDNEVVHVGIKYGEAASAKKEILSCEVNFLEIIKKMRAFSLLRKREFILKNRMRKTLAEMKVSVLQIKSKLPKVEETTAQEEGSKVKLKEMDISAGELINLQQRELKREKQQKTEKRKNLEIEKELEDIKAQLERFGG